MSQEANPGLIFLEKVRLSFPHLAAPHASAVGATPKFSGDFIMEPNHPGYAQFHAMVQAKALEKLGAQTNAILQFIQQDRKLRSYGVGEECIDKSTLQPYLGYPGHVFVKANNAVQPAMFDAAGTQLMDARMFYGGCYVNVQIQPWIQDNTHGRAVRCELVGIQFHSDGESFGVAPVDPNSLFGAVPGAPAAIAPGVAPVVPGVAPVAQPPVGVAPVGYPPASPGVVPAVAAPGVAPATAPPVTQPGGVQPGGYDPALYPAPTAQPPGAAAPVQPNLGVPGVAPATGLPPGQLPAVAPGINPQTGLPYQ